MNFDLDVDVDMNDDGYFLKPEAFQGAVRFLPLTTGLSKSIHYKDVQDQIHVQVQVHVGIMAYVSA